MKKLRRLQDEYFNSLPDSHFREGILILEKRWAKSIEVKGNNTADYPGLVSCSLALDQYGGARQWKRPLQFFEPNGIGIVSPTPTWHLSGSGRSASRKTICVPIDSGQRLLMAIFPPWSLAILVVLCTAEYSVGSQHSVSFHQ
ncbi:hypothetical protein LAZ67_X002332 [Cordylochernes scorpioides]|uniref:Uncharacterized protein n=1 Tax=Cordylochernes scorpioides TaxID=51811 RepID=A0ABY6LTA6_9ARAC|nr:hypothetical protein LAZ67_X002332 [Cordylochernes scorpioides]